jgi:putative salt-induced outer membrane protein YdiY
VLLSTNGERFAGVVVEETVEVVVFDSELAGRLKIPRSRVLEIQRAAPAAPAQLLEVTNQPPVLAFPATNAVASSDLDWRPPGVGLGHSDWIQLKSGEWLKGRLRYIQQRKVEFDSDEVDDLSLDLKDVRQAYPARPMFTKFDDREQIYGKVVVSNEVVEVLGLEQVRLPRAQLTGITPGGKRELDFWSGDFNIGLSLQSGNTRQMTWSVSAELARRTPSTLGQLNFLGNYGEVEGVQNANNQRLTGSFDILLNRRWFLRPAYLEYYQDRLANIANQGTVAAGMGYFIFDREGLEWRIFGGPGYQYTKFTTVEAGQSDTAQTPAGVLQIYFKTDLTRRLKFTETITVTLTREDAGLYSHHAVSTLEFEIKRHLDLNLSFVWDYLQNPQTGEDGVLPQRSDFRLNVGLGVDF